MGNYLYNGIELPALPKWDKETYLYAYIGLHVLTNGRSRYYLYLSTQPFFVKENGYCATETVGSCVVYECLNSSTAWSETDSYDTSPDSLCRPPVWASYDMYDANGTLYLAASEPTPVTSAPAPDPTSMLMGWLVGRAIAGQRA